MPIKLSYHTSKITKSKKKLGSYDLKVLKKDLRASLSDLGCWDEVSESSGIYIYYRTERGGGWKADYVGKNYTGNLFNESLSKGVYLLGDILPKSGKHNVLYITCKRPQGMSTKTYKDNIVSLESYLITYLSIKGHELVNIQHNRKRKLFDFSLQARRHNGQSAFKNLVRDPKSVRL